MKDYGFPVVRILNQFQTLLYISHNLKPVDIYVSKNDKDEYRLVYVFDRFKSHDLFSKFRNHELDVGLDVTQL